MFDPPQISVALPRASPTTLARATGPTGARRIHAHNESRRGVVPAGSPSLENAQKALARKREAEKWKRKSRCSVRHLNPSQPRRPTHAAGRVGRNLYPSARVIAVELDGGNAKIARRNLEHFGARCVVIHAAVWLHDGEVNYEGDEEWAFHISRSSTGNPDAPTAPSITMPTLLNALELDRVDYLKMDVEGAEAELISDSASWLDRIESLKVEVHPPATVSTCASVLVDRGFDVSVDERHGATVIATR